MATNPMSLIGEFVPENTSLTAADTAPDEPSYGCGLSGPGEGPTVIGPSVSGFVAAMKPAPARLQPSPFMSMNEPESEEHTSELQSQSNIVCRLLLEKKKIKNT